MSLSGFVVWFDIYGGVMDLVTRVAKLLEYSKSGIFNWNQWEFKLINRKKHEKLGKNRKLLQLKPELFFLVLLHTCVQV